MPVRTGTAEATFGPHPVYEHEVEVLTDEGPQLFQGRSAPDDAVRYLHEVARRSGEPLRVVTVERPSSELPDGAVTVLVIEPSGDYYQEGGPVDEHGNPVRLHLPAPPEPETAGAAPAQSADLGAAAVEVPQPTPGLDDQAPPRPGQAAGTQAEYGVELDAEAPSARISHKDLMDEMNRRVREWERQRIARQVEAEYWARGIDPATIAVTPPVWVSSEAEIPQSGGGAEPLPAAVPPTAPQSAPPATSSPADHAPALSGSQSADAAAEPEVSGLRDQFTEAWAEEVPAEESPARAPARTIKEPKPRGRRARGALRWVLAAAVVVALAGTFMALRPGASPGTHSVAAAAAVSISGAGELEATVTGLSAGDQVRFTAAAPGAAPVEATAIATAPSTALVLHAGVGLATWSVTVDGKPVANGTAQVEAGDTGTGTDAPSHSPSPKATTKTTSKRHHHPGRKPTKSSAPVSQPTYQYVPPAYHYVAPPATSSKPSHKPTATKPAVPSTPTTQDTGIPANPVSGG